MRYIENTTTGLLGMVDFGKLTQLKGADSLEIVVTNRSDTGVNVFLLAEGSMLSENESGIVAEGCRSRMIHTRANQQKKTSMYIHDLPKKGTIAVYASHPAVQILLKFKAAEWNDYREVLFDTISPRYRIRSVDGRVLVEGVDADDVGVFLTENEFADGELPKIEVMNK